MAAVSIATSQADAHHCRCHHRYLSGCETFGVCPRPVPVQAYYNCWGCTLRLVREQIYELPAGYRNVCINGIHYYYYDWGVYRGCCFRALGETAGVTYIYPP